METAGQPPRRCERQGDLHSPVSKGWPQCLGPALTAAHSSKNQHTKSTEQLGILNIGGRIWSLMVPYPYALNSSSIQAQPLAVALSPDICKHLTVAGIRTYRCCCNLLGFINSPCSLIHVYHSGTLHAAGYILVLAVLKFIWYLSLAKCR